jgi:hypothetical protein
MSDTATADKKQPDLSTKENYTDRVTVREWAGDKFIHPIAGVPALWREIRGEPVVYVWSKSGGANAPKGSEITDPKTGDVWVVDESKRGRTFTVCYVTKRS